MSQYILELNPEKRLLMLAAQNAVVQAITVRDSLMEGFVREVLSAAEPGSVNLIEHELSVEPNGAEPDSTEKIEAQ
jgi:hypothetical protein